MQVSAIISFYSCLTRQDSKRILEYADTFYLFFYLLSASNSREKSCGAEILELLKNYILFLLLLVDITYLLFFILLQYQTKKKTRGQTLAQ